MHSLESLGSEIRNGRGGGSQHSALAAGPQETRDPRDFDLSGGPLEFRFVLVCTDALFAGIHILTRGAAG
jgi:hypothetical protein